MVDFGALPPEVNSARMYTGPGSSSLQAAASAWNGLAAELQSAAQGYETTITQLANDGWNGPASTAMASAAQPYVTWMQETAAAAEQAATQARTAAAAYEQAFAATVPPPMIAANRAETAAATQANIFGQYTSLIAQLEAQYGQMWAQDAAAMYGYAGQSAASAKVTPFATPAATTDPGGTASQAAAVSSATGTSAATSSQSVLQQLTSSMPKLAAEPCVACGQPVGHLDAASVALQLLVRNERPAHKPLGVGDQLLAVRQLLLQHRGSAVLQRWYGQLRRSDREERRNAGWGCSCSCRPGTARLEWPGSRARQRCCWSGGCRRACGVRHFGRGRFDRQTGGAGIVGRCNSAGGPARVQMVSHVVAAPEAAGGNGNLLGGMPLAGTRAGGFGSGPRYGFKPTVMPRPPSAG